MVSDLDLYASTVTTGGIRYELYSPAYVHYGPHYE